MNRVRGYGDFLHYHLLAAGKIDAVVESDVNILDIAACAAIVPRPAGDSPISTARRLGCRRLQCLRPTAGCMDRCSRRSRETAGR